MKNLEGLQGIKQTAESAGDKQEMHPWTGQKSESANFSNSFGGSFANKWFFFSPQVTESLKTKTFFYKNASLAGHS